MYDRTTVQGATFNMRGQLFRGHANATALCSSPVVSEEVLSWSPMGVKGLNTELLYTTASPFLFHSFVLEHLFKSNLRSCIFDGRFCT